MYFFEVLFESGFAVLKKIGWFSLDLFTVLSLLVLGWILALLLKKTLILLFRKINLDKHFAGSRIERFLKRGGISKPLTEVLAGFLYWVVIVVFIVAVFQVMSVESGTGQLERFLIFLPRVIAFGLILVFGVIFGTFLGKVFQIVSANLGIKEFKIIGRVIQTVVIIYAGLMALEQLGIAILAVAASFNVFWAAICLTLVLALGLGGQDLVKNFLDNFAGKYAGKKKSMKTELFSEFKGKSGSVRTVSKKMKKNAQQEELFGDD